MEGSKRLESPKENPHVANEVFGHATEASLEEIDYTSEPYQERGQEERYFQDYVETLELTPEDFEKDILDIGGAEGAFAYYALQHGINDHIVTLEPMKTESYKGIEVYHEPLEHNSIPKENFDLVVSNHSMPGYLFNFEHSYEENLERMKLGIGEMLRVLRPGGEVRMQWSFGKLYPPQKEYAKVSFEVIRYLQSLGIETLFKEDEPQYERDADDNNTRVLKRWFRVRLIKPE